MAFQTNVFRHGEWVTETIDLQAILKANATTRPQKQRLLKPPECAVLTRTVVESPVIHTILPVRIRSAHHLDVAFVGDHFVQISELQKDGRLRNVIRKSDFGSRIRNAKVIGIGPDENRDDGDFPNIAVKSENDDDIVMKDADSSLPPELPPQMLLLVLESGDCVFLFLHTARDGVVGFETSSFSTSSHLKHPGFHLAVDPSSRYIALGCTENHFIVYELESTEDLRKQYSEQFAKPEREREPLNFIRKSCPRSVYGVINHIEFLYPRPADDYHIILLLIVVKNGMSRMVTFDWEAAEEDLKDVLRHEKKGYMLPPEHQIPILLIPLKVRTAFLAISPNSIAVCKDVLQGPPEFEDFRIQDHQTSEFHHGIYEPLWTAWTRPYRLPSAHATRDHIYLAREDGVVTYLDIDSENIPGATSKILKSECNISTAFCSLFDKYSDILIIGGDSGPGTIWQVPPRQKPIHMGMLPNWSPAVDFVTTDEFSTWNQGISSRGAAMVPWRDRPFNTFANPDKIYITSGRGITGAVTEYRQGIPANIGLDVDYQVPIRQSWMFPAHLKDSTLGFHILLSLPDRSAILHLSEDLVDAEEPGSEAIPYDLSSRTIAARRTSSNMIVQVTENFLVLNSETQSTSRLHMDIFSGEEVIIADAFILDDLIALSTHSGLRFHIRLLRIADDGAITVAGTYGVDGEVTCLSLAKVAGVSCIVAGLLRDGTSSIALYPIDESQSDTPRIIELSPDSPDHISSPAYNNQHSLLVTIEPLTSVVCISQGQGVTLLVLGTRSGEVLTVALGESGQLLSVRSEKFGITAANVAIFESLSYPNSIVVCCDSKPILLTDFQVRQGGFRNKHNIWLIDTNEPSKDSPSINSVTVPQHKLPTQRDATQLLFASGSRILLTELQNYPGPVPRSLPVGGTPSKLIYSHSLDCLVVAVTVEDKPTLKFIDPDTGEDLSRPTDKDSGAVDFISGLGKAGDRIFGLAEWEYRKDGDKWVFLLVTTRDGRLLIISTSPPETNSDSTRGTIRYWTRTKKSGFDCPIYCVVGDAENLIFCAGDTIHWEVLDLEERKLKPMKTFEVSSEATSIRVVNGKIVVVTKQDSLLVIDPAANAAPEPMSLVHVDPKSRSSTHLIEVAGGQEDANVSMILLSDRASGVAGLWPPWQQPGKDCDILFEGELPSSVRKFRRGRTRPGWEQAQRSARYGLVPSTVDGADILGICLDGSMQHFTLLKMDIWMILRLIQNLAYISPILYPFSHHNEADDFNPEPVSDRSSEMQIDGDMLQRCLDQRLLETLFEPSARMERLVELLGKLDSGKWTKDFKECGTEDEKGRRGNYIDLLYDILEYYLAPVV